MKPRSAWTASDRIWEDMMVAQVEVNRLASVLGQIDFEKDPERFSEVTEMHTRAIEQRAVAEAAWHVLIVNKRKRGTK